MKIEDRKNNVVKLINSIQEINRESIRVNSGERGLYIDFTYDIKQDYEDSHIFGVRIRIDTMESYLRTIRELFKMKRFLKER